MQLNRFLPDNELPAVLKKPLVFGDRAQIEALNEVELTINEKERGEILSSGFKKYRVIFDYSAEHTVDVFAKDKEEAQKIAEEEHERSDIEMELDFTTVREIEGN